MRLHIRKRCDGALCFTLWRLGNLSPIRVLGRSMAVLADRIDDALRTELAPMGFELVRPRRWVSGTKDSIRRIFEFQALKGATYSARWGFSLDFVPIARKGHLRWKRTPTGAEFYLCIT